MLLKENVTDEVALESMRHCLNENDNADFNEFFELLDEDGDGFATAKNVIMTINLNKIFIFLSV